MLGLYLDGVSRFVHRLLVCIEHSVYFLTPLIPYYRHWGRCWYFSSDGVCGEITGSVPNQRVREGSRRGNEMSELSGLLRRDDSIRENSSRFGSMLSMYIKERRGLRTKHRTALLSGAALTTLASLVQLWHSLILCRCHAVHKELREVFPTGST